MAPDKKFQDDVVSRLTAIGDSVAGLDKKVDLHIQKTEYELRGIRTLDEQQNKLIDQHIEGVKNLRFWLDRHEADDVKRFNEIAAGANVRLAALEAPKVWWKQTIKFVLKAGAIAVGLAAMVEIWLALAHRGG